MKTPLERLAAAKSRLDMARIDFAGAVYKVQHGAAKRGGEAGLIRDLERLSRDLGELRAIVDDAAESVRARVAEREAAAAAATPSHPGA
jgi:hypothetical protein